MVSECRLEFSWPSSIKELRRHWYEKHGVDTGCGPFFSLGYSAEEGSTLSCNLSKWRTGDELYKCFFDMSFFLIFIKQWNSLTWFLRHKEMKAFCC